jgi:predicted CXXCH cytochrome family protein
MKWLIGASFVTVLGAWLVALYGCGGGGGPIKVTPPTEGLPSPSAEFLALLPEGQRGATFVGSERCADCHGGRQATVEPIYVSWSKTKHAKVNVGCEHCHGPGSKHAEAPSKDNILTYPNITRSVVCGQCHGPIYDDHKRSAHSEVVEALIDPNFVGSNPRLYIATCYRCHSAPFRVELVDGKLARGISRDQVDADIAALSNDQLLSYRPVSHETASCVTCHDPHRSTGNLTIEGKEVQLRRSVFNMDTTDIAPGTPPKQHTTFNHICASCHNGRGANPSDSALQTATARPNMHESNQFNMLVGIGGVESVTGGQDPALPAYVRRMAHAEAPGQCVHCHMPDSRHTMTVSYDKGCTPCHNPADASVRASAVKSEIQLALFTLRERLRRWAQQQFGDPDLWDYTALIGELGKTAPPQGQVPIEVKRARHNYYFVLRDASFGIHNAPYARHLITIANDQLDRLGVPRIAPQELLSRLNRRQIQTVLQADLQRLKASTLSER